MAATSLSDLFPAMLQGEPRLYAYSIPDVAHDGLLKVGQTVGDVKTRVRQQTSTAAVQAIIHVDEPAYDADGVRITDTMVRKRLVAKGFENVDFSTIGGGREWMRCTVQQVLTAITELREHRELSGTRHESFGTRDEQAEAISKTLAFFRREWDADPEAVPRFLWNAKMRFGKTFTSYQLAKQMRARRVLVVTYKPAVEDSWQTDLESHSDFEGWQYASAKSPLMDPTKADPTSPLVYFGSFQDLLGRDRATGLIKSKNEWLHAINWDLVIFDEYHFGAWRENAKELFEGEDTTEAKAEIAVEFSAALEAVDEEMAQFGEAESSFLPITTRAFLYLSGTPFRAIAEGEFVDDNLFNWTYTDEQRVKTEWLTSHPEKSNPYAALPQMCLMTYQMPDELITVASQGEFDEFDLNGFFEATGEGTNAVFRHPDDVQKWLDIIRGGHLPTSIDALRVGSRPPFPYSDTHVLPYLNHSFWFLPTVASVGAMAGLLKAPQNQKFWGEYEVLNVSGPGAGIGLAALPPVRRKIKDGFATKTITLSCGKLTTGVTVPQWSAILMLRNLTRPETYFQAAFRVQSPWAITNPNGNDPNEVEVVKPVCFVFDFAPTRALRQVADYARGLAPDQPNDDKAVADLLAFLPVLAYDGANMVQIDAGSVLDISASGTSATLLARKWESAILVNVDNDTLKRIMGNQEALDAVSRIEGFRRLGVSVFETIINKTERIKELKKKAKTAGGLSKEDQKELTKEEKERKSLRKQVQEKLIKFSTRIPAFMYLTDFRENTLKDVITKLEPDLFRSVTGLTVKDFDLLVSLGLFNSSHMNEAIKTFRRFEDASLSYTGVDSHEGLRHWGLFDTVVEVEGLLAG
ncbi:DEAD/DEAH box helicase family protein [Cryobacterium sp. N21]|uniref:DEAD/DEAH box helicase family protein n=1 Tax=Cryobacterium sp. N21 TaxID=2048289 RepID=UPI000CE3338E|nr:DEAD/DEAH box helicase family protein [Cryobacterium sp. N21]